MFETVVPEAVAPRTRKLFFELLPLSVGIHALAGVSLLAASVWNVVFPQQSPRLYATYSLIAEPPLPPPPPPPPVTARPAATQPRAVQVKMPLVAPPFIPDEIPTVLEQLAEEAPVMVKAVAPDPGPPSGVEEGVQSGETGGELGGVAGSVAVPRPPIVEVRRDEPLPMGAISQEFPTYPENARTRGIEDTLVVRYIIGKDGRVKDVIILRPPERQEFAHETVSAMRYWRFHPYRDETGEPKEVAHELTVEFRLAKPKSRAAR